MRSAKRLRKERAERENEVAGLVYSFVPGSNFPSGHNWEKFNSEAKERKVDSSLFADDTGGIGKKKELEV